MQIIESVQELEGQGSSEMAIIGQMLEVVEVNQLSSSLEQLATARPQTPGRAVQACAVYLPCMIVALDDGMQNIDRAASCPRP